MALILPSQNLDPKEKALRIQVFWETFEHHKIENMEEAFKWARENLKYFPTPKELIDHMVTEGNRKYLESNNKEIQIAWKPTEGGKAIAQGLVKAMVDKFELQEVNFRKERESKFEQRRDELKKQAKLLKEVKF